MKKRRIIFATAAAAFLAVWAALLQAHHYDPSKNYQWPAVRPVGDHALACSRTDFEEDVTLLARPVRVDVDTEPPGRYAVRAVRFILRSLTCGDETTIAFEGSLFLSEGEMKTFARHLASFERAPIISIRFRGVHDPDSPTYSSRWRAVQTPYWIEIPAH